MFARFSSWLYQERQGWRQRARLFGLGAASALALPPLFLAPLWFLGFVGLILAINRANTYKQAFAAGWWFAFGHHVVGLYWIAISLLVDAARFAWLIPFAVSLIPAVLALLAGGVGAIAHWLKRWNMCNPISIAALWSLSEFIRGETFIAFPWNPVASIWSFADAPLQLASVIGAHGLGLLTMMLAGLLALGGLKASHHRHYALALAGGGVLLVFCFGVFRLPTQKPEVWDTMPIHIVQANIPQSLKWNQQLALQHLRHHLELSRTEKPAIVIWPEVAIPFLVEPGTPVLGYIAEQLNGNWLIAGASRRDKNVDAKAIWNSIIVLSPNGEIVDAYDKVRLVPFGEFIPFRAWIPFIDRIAGGLGELAPGTTVKTVDIGNGMIPFAGLVCYEAIFSHGILSSSGKRAEWFLNVTNDAWFGNSSGPYQHLHQARLRAIEYGLPLIRAANTGISAVIDPYGRILQKLGINTDGNINTFLPKPLSGETIYSRYGNVGYFLLVTMCALVSLGLRRNAR